MKGLPIDNRGAVLERVVRCLLGRDCRLLLQSRKEQLDADICCRLLSYLGWHKCSEALDSYVQKNVIDIIGEILAQMHLGLYNAERVLDWLVATPWIERTESGDVEFPDQRHLHRIHTLYSR